jgi:predicted ATPase
MYVKSVTLENFKGFKHLEFNFQRPGAIYAGWTVFVGGNASGKSALLRGIALALMGPDASRQLLGSPADWKGWMHKAERRTESLLELAWDEHLDNFKMRGKLPGQAFEAGVRFVMEGKDSLVPVLRGAEQRSRQGTRILTALRGPWDPNARGWFAAGYGPMRRLSGSSSESMRFSVGRGTVSRFVTLFREDAALSESEAWLKTNHSRWLETKAPDQKQLIDGVQAMLNDDLLPLGMQISRITVDHVFIKDKGGLELPMRDISDGCRSVYATVLDLVHGMYEVYGIQKLFEKQEGKPVVTRPGVVLVDEIEAHLHPAWQRDIPEWLKRHFPNVQFLVTTHSPLVAQAADPNGVFVMPSQSDPDREPRPLEQAEFERLRLGRAEKTLLGVAFGLQSVRSSWANQQIERWKRLNAKSKSGAELTSPEKQDLEKLRKQMDLAFEPGAETGDAALTS